MTRQTSPLWVLVIDSTRCRILRSLDAGTDEAPRELVLRAESPHLRDVIAETPGGTMGPTGAGRKQETAYRRDLAAKDRRQFLGQVIALLESHRRAGDFERVAIFAERGILGVLRQMLPQSVRERVILERAKDLVQLSTRDLVVRINHELTNGPDLS